MSSRLWLLPQSSVPVHTPIQPRRGGEEVPLGSPAGPIFRIPVPVVLLSSRTLGCWRETLTSGCARNPHGARSSHPKRGACVRADPHLRADPHSRIRPGCRQQHSC